MKASVEKNIGQSEAMSHKEDLVGQISIELLTETIAENNFTSHDDELQQTTTTEEN